MTTDPIHPATRMGHVHYTTANLKRQLAFYRDILGFKLHWESSDSAGLGAGGADLLRLTEQRGAQQVQGTTGLYHTAFLVPTRKDLARLLKRIAETRTPIQGMTNHGTHLAIYLPDAEDNGIELAWDFPQEVWPKTAGEMLANRRLTPQEVFSPLTDADEPWGGLDPATVVGHVHLHVARIDATERFYRGMLGFGVPFDFTTAPGPFAGTAMFFAAGSYHHHIGTNVWQGVGAPPPPPTATGLRYYSAVLPSEAEYTRLVSQLEGLGTPLAQAEGGVAGVIVRDPSHNRLLLTYNASADVPAT